IREEVDPDANIIFGSTFDEKLAGRMRISVVATGIEAEAGQMALPSLAPTRPVLAEVKLAAAAPGYTQPMLTQNAAAPKTEPSRARALPPPPRKRSRSRRPPQQPAPPPRHG